MASAIEEFAVLDWKFCFQVTQKEEIKSTLIYEILLNAIFTCLLDYVYHSSLDPHNVTQVCKLAILICKLMTFSFNLHYQFETSQELERIGLYGMYATSMSILWIGTSVIVSLL